MLIFCFENVQLSLRRPFYQEHNVAVELNIVKHYSSKQPGFHVYHLQHTFLDKLKMVKQ